jgi:PAS domain S-box-containing protein
MKRGATYWTVGLGLIAAAVLLRDSSWRGSVGLHTLMETVATLLAAIVGVMALVRFYSKKNNTILFIATGFLGTAFLDGYHALVTSEVFRPYMPSDLPSLIPWSWVASRLFLALMIFLSWLAWLRERRLGPADGLDERTIYVGTFLLTAASFLFFTLAPLPRAYYPELFFPRPEEFVPALFFLLALIGYLRKGAWRNDAFEHWLVMALIVGFVGQAVFMPFSGQLFDFEFDAAHLLKKVSYVCVLTGLMISMFTLIRRAEDGETRVRTVADTTLDGIITIDACGTVHAFNLGAERVFGFPAEEVIGRNVNTLIPEPDRSLHDSYIKNYLETGVGKVIGIGREVTARRRDGTEVSIDLDIREMRVGGRRMFVGRCRDISEHKWAEAEIQKRTAELAAANDALQATTRTLQTIIGASPVAIVAIDREGHVTGWNATAETIFGWSESEALGRPYLPVPESERAAFENQVKAELDGNTFFDLEVTRQRKSGELFQASLASAPLRDEDGNVVGSVSLLTDISERKRAERALRESEQRLRDLVEGSIEGILVHRDHKPLLVNEAWADIHGYTVAEVMAMESVVTLMAPHERERMVEFKTARLRGENRPTRYDYQAVHKDGSLVWMENLVRTVTWEGSPAIQSVVVDINERKRAEEALRQSESRFRDVAEASSDWVWEMDETLRFTYISHPERFTTVANMDTVIGRTRWEVADVDPDQHDRWQQHRADLEAHRPFRDFRYDFVDGNGNRQFRRVSGSPISDEDGVFRGYRGAATDETAMMEAENAALLASERLASAIEGSTQFMALWDADDRLVICNERFRQINRAIPEATKPGIRFVDHIRAVMAARLFPDAVGREDEWLEDRLRRHRNPEAPFEIQRQDGQWVLIREERLADGGVITASTDITERKRTEEALRRAHDELEQRIRERTTELRDANENLRQEIAERAKAEQALREAEERFRAIFEQAAVGIGLMTPGGRFLAINEKLCELMHHTAEELLELKFEDFTHPDDYKRCVEQVARVVAGDTSTVSVEMRYVPEQGTMLWGNLTVSVLREAASDSYALLGIVEDITDRKRAEQARRASEKRFRDFAEASADWFWEMDAELRFTYMSPNVEWIVGVPPEWHYGKTREDLLGDDYDHETWDSHLEAMRERQPFRDFTYLRQGEGVEPRWLRASGVPVFDDKGTFLGYRGSGTDVTATMEAQQGLRESRDQLRLVTDNLPVLIAYIDSEQRVKFANKVAAEWVHRQPHELLGLALQDFLSAEIYDKLKPRFEAALSGQAVNYEDVIAYAPGEFRSVATTLVPDIGKNGEVRGYFSLIIDISERKAVEEQLRQAQKMEAVGQLTGGIAHDFNNLLTVIFGNLELLKDAVDGAEPGRAYAEAALLAADRGADLTDRLLAFSRQQTLDPIAIDLEKLIGNSVELMKRALGEDISIRVDIAGDAWRPKADPNQLENALINLAVNARDAMPKGGVLAIKATNETLEPDPADAHPEVAPGDYVVIAVSDTGSGIAPDILARVFDPFFTTKGVGEGSGLGLSMVYGFAKQSDGHARIESEPGSGTTVQLYLPRAEADGPVDQATHLVDGETPRGEETLLVVEDDGAVRSFTTYALDSLGYQVLDVADGPAAISVLEATPNIDLVITDVVLPHGMNGRDVADAVRRRFPEVKVMYTSGYADRALDREEIQKGDIELLPKPYTLDTLGRRVRNVLDGSERPPARLG